MSNSCPCVSDGIPRCNCMYHRCLTSSGPDWVLFKHHSLTIKLHKIVYMSMLANKWVHQKDTCMYKENYTTWRDDEFFKESETYMYLGGKRWVRNEPNWVLFKNHSFTRRLHKIIYVNVNKSMGAPKRYLHVQRKLYYMEGK